jgi:hypothetical protein
MSCGDMDDRARAEVLAADHFIMGFGGNRAAARARAELFGGAGEPATATELLDPSDVSVRGGEFEPLRGSPAGVGQEWTWVRHKLDAVGHWVPAASDAIMRAHPGPIENKLRARIKL